MYSLLLSVILLYAFTLWSHIHYETFCQPRLDIDTKVHNYTISIQIQHLAAGDHCSASYLTFMMYHFKFSVAVFCIVIFLHILTINVYFPFQYVVHQTRDIINQWCCAHFTTLRISIVEFRNINYVFSIPRATARTHVLGFAAGSWPLLRLRGAARCRGQATTVMSKVSPIDGRGIHVPCKYANVASCD
jgi:hypothetical protein